MNIQSSAMSEKARLGLKCTVIIIIILLLLIPANLIQDVIREREARQKEAIAEVSSKWAEQQTITGPILAIPFNEVSANGSKTRHTAYVLPATLNITTNLKPEVRHRGIFDVILYTATVSMKGSFGLLPLDELKIEPANILWDEVRVCVGITDPGGLKDEVKLEMDSNTYTLSPMSLDNAIMPEGFAAKIKFDSSQTLQFAADLNISGSGRILFTPVGKTMQVKLVSSWPHPSFTGPQLPDHRITDSGFVANWTAKAHGRTFPQFWKDSNYKLESSAFGAEVFIAVKGYQKTMRSIKYAILCIVLTFAAFFIIETVSRRSVHPLHYGLIGIALILFYTLLLSISEYTGFNIAYLISTLATTGLISWFVRGILHTGKLSMLMAFVLMLIYSYLFTILQLQDYSLLFGSIGLFITLAVVMYFSRNVKW